MLRYLDWLEVLCGSIGVIRYKTSKLYAKAKDANLYIPFSDCCIRYSLPFKRCAGKVIVGYQYREVSELKLLCEAFDASIKIMIAHCCRIVAHGRHGFYFWFSFIEIEVR